MKTLNLFLATVLQLAIPLVAEEDTVNRPDTSSITHKTTDNLSIESYTTMLPSEPHVPNYDESQADKFPLPSPLVLPNGEVIKTATQWQSRRVQILKDFTRVMYGEIPPRPQKVWFELRQEVDGALDGTAIRREVRIHLEQNGKQHCIDALWYLPKQAKEPIPAIVAMNFRGNHTCTVEEDVIPTEFFPHKNGERGNSIRSWDFRLIIQAGFSIITAFRGDLFPDRADGRPDSVYRIFHEEGELSAENRSLTAISAWAFGYSRLVDLLESEPRIDRSRIWAHGHSRLGKTALWAVANDLRFAGAASNDSGCCGAAPSRRYFGETLGIITEHFPWWFPKELDHYVGRESDLPFEQHWLLGLIAPRPVLVASASEDRWADPRGEFLSAKEVGYVYQLFGSNGIFGADFPATDQPIFGDSVGYYLRTGAHGVMSIDWKFFIDFIGRNS